MTFLLGRAEVERFRELVSRRLGLHFDDGKLDFLGDVLRKRLGATQCPEPASYLDRLGAAPAELRAVAQQLTVSETYFFRNADHQRAFVETAVRDRMRARAAQRHLRILSAGCASGEEAYTLAILLRDCVPELEGWNVELRGIDVNPAMIAKAQRARYSAWSLRQTPPEVRDRWFRPAGGEYELVEPVRAMAAFEERNLIEDDASFWRAGAFDVVFCRNVVMYFAPEVVREVISRIARALRPDGYLFLGHAETLRGVSAEFHLRHTHDTFYYQRRSESEAPATRPPRAEVPPGPPASATRPEDPSWFEAIQRAADRIAVLTDRPLRNGAAEAAASSPPPARTRDRPDLTGASDLLRQERYGEALQALHRLPTESRADPDALLLRAVLLTSSGDLAEATRACRQLLALDELNAGAHYVMALCSEHAGDPRAAAEHDDIAAYLDPNFAMPHLHRGLLARRAGDLAAARGEFERACRLLDREDAARILLFGGGFRREALISLCEGQLRACGGGS
ncbi:MAG TPA: CheR family methyltransferase [Myxococcales bacterium]